MGEAKVSITVRALLRDHPRIKQIAQGLPMICVVDAQKAVQGSIDAENKYRPQIAALLEDIERLTTQVEDMKVRLENCAKASDDDKTRYWMGRYKMLEKEAKERGWLE